MPALRGALAKAEATRDSALASVEAARRAGEAARAAVAVAERDARDSARAGDSAEAQLERLASQRAALDERLADLSPLVEAAAEAGWDVATPGELLGDVPFLSLDCGRADDEPPLEGGPQALLCDRSSLAGLEGDGPAVGFHALPPLADARLVYREDNRFLSLAVAANPFAADKSPVPQPAAGAAAHA